MKKILFSAAVIMAAMTSCNKEEANVNAPEAQDSKIWVEFSAGVATKAALSVVDNVNTIVWEENDAISVNGEILSTEETGAKVTFGGEVSENFLSADAFSAIYPASAGTSFNAITVDDTQSAVAGGFEDIVAVAYSADQSLQFKHVTSLIKFQIPSDYTVNTVTISADEALAGVVSVAMTEEDALPAITVTEGVNAVSLSGTFEAGKDYYVAVLPGVKTNLTVRFDGYLSNVWENAEIKQGQVADMKVLPAPVVSEKYGIAGTIQTAPWDASNPIALYEDVNNTLIAKNVELFKDDAFKVVVNKSWDEAYGDNGNNFVVNKNGMFDIAFNISSKTITATCVEEYKNLEVAITIDNKANWSPLYINLWKGEELIADNAEVTDNKYTISGDYIGETLTYQLGNGSKSTEVIPLSITKDGAGVILEETIVKLKVQLTTDNAKQWWGSTMKIHVWNAGPEFDTNWPGHTMTSEGNYTWSIIIPSDLIGKTINYKVHNGNGWESNNSTLNVSAEGHTIDATSLGVN